MSSRGLRMPSSFFADLIQMFSCTAEEKKNAWNLFGDRLSALLS